MKTFLTEKHNIPEGATHYADETVLGYFAWVKFVDGERWRIMPDSMSLNTWHREDTCNIKPIPQTNIETPEEKEALDTMKGISREHLMKMINQQSEIIKELSEKLNTSESPNGSNEIIKPLWAKWSIGDSVTKTKGSSWTGKVVGYYQTDLTSKGYAVESETEKGSVQIYPEAALRDAATPKTKKEKRWIATFPWTGNAFYVTPEHFDTKEMLSDYVYMHYGEQALMVFHQIEVEV